MRYTDNFTIEVTKEDLLSVLTKNREQHIKSYNLAIGQYRMECIEELAQKLENVQDDKIPMGQFLMFNKLVPRTYEKEYNTVIGMLTMTIDKTFKINGATYRAWVLDEWEWKDSFASNTMDYARKLM